MPTAKNLKSLDSQNEISGTKRDFVTCLGFDLVVQELLFKLGQSIVGAVIVQIQRVEDVPEEGKTTAGSLLIVSVKVGRFIPAWAM